MTSNQIQKVYNQVAHLYNQDRKNLGNSKYLNKFLQLLPAKAHVLDLGCGNGLPIAEKLLKKGHLVTGLDFSEQQIFLAKKNCPRGEFLVADIANLQIDDYKVDAIVCYYTLFHLPRKDHGQFLKTFNSFLPLNGLLLITMGEKDFEGWHDFYGQKMWSSHYGPEQNRQLLKEAGFEILIDEIDFSNREQHQVIIARKIK